MVGLHPGIKGNIRLLINEFFLLFGDQPEEFVYFQDRDSTFAAVSFSIKNKRSPQDIKADCKSPGHLYVFEVQPNEETIRLTTTDGQHGNDKLKWTGLLYSSHSITLTEH